MKKIVLFISVNLFFVVLHSQNVEIGDNGKVIDHSKTDNPEAVESHLYNAFGASYYFLPLSNVNSHLNQMGINPGFTNALGLGLEHGYKVITSKLKNGLTGLLAFHYLLPQQLSNSTLNRKATLNGYNAQFDLIGTSFLDNQKFTFTGGLGWAFGRLKMTEDNAGAKTIYLNKYFAPQFRIELNVRFAEHFYIGIRDGFRYDVTKPIWSKTGASLIDIADTRMLGNMIGAFIGYGK